MPRVRIGWPSAQAGARGHDIPCGFEPRLLDPGQGPEPVKVRMVGRYAPFGSQKSLKPRDTLYTLPSETQPDHKHV